MFIKVIESSTLILIQYVKTVKRKVSCHGYVISQNKNFLTLENR